MLFRVTQPKLPSKGKIVPADSAYPPAVSPTNITDTNKNGHGAAVFAGFLGWTLDAFDFFLVVLSLTAIAQEFVPTKKLLSPSH
jgi:hypothetical protein